jgi:hypothetical protein
MFDGKQLTVIFTQLELDVSTVIVVEGRPHITSSNEGEGVTPLMTFDDEGEGGYFHVDVITTILGKLLYSLLKLYIMVWRRV